MKKNFLLIFFLLICATGYCQFEQLTINDVICTLHKYLCKQGYKDKNDTLFILINVDSTFINQNKKDYEETIYELIQKFQNTPIRIQKPSKNSPVYFLEYPIESRHFKKYFVVSVGCATYCYENGKEIIRTGGWIEMFYKNKRGKLKVKKFKEYGI